MTTNIVINSRTLATLSKRDDHRYKKLKLSQNYFAVFYFKLTTISLTEIALEWI